MSFSILGDTISLVAKDLGIHSAALNDVTMGLKVMGDMVRSVNALHIIYEEALTIINALQDDNTAGEVANAAAKTTTIAATEAETDANLGLAASFEAIDVAMGPIGWIGLAAGIGVAAGLGGYALAGGFGGGAAPAAPVTPAAPATPTAPATSGGETTNFYFYGANLQATRDQEAIATTLNTMYHHKRRAYGR